MDIAVKDQYASLRQHVHGTLQASEHDNQDTSRRDCASSETVNIDLTVSSHSSSREATSEGSAATPADGVFPCTTAARTTVGAERQGKQVDSDLATGGPASAPTVTVASAGGAEGEEGQLQAPRYEEEETFLSAAAAPRRETPPASSPTASRSKPGDSSTPASQRKPSRASVRRSLLSAATSPAKPKAKVAVPAAARIAELLNGIPGSPSKSATPEKAQGSRPLPPLHTIDLPLGLLLLYCAAEDQCTAVEGGATSSAYSLLYQLERLSDLRRRDRRKAARAQASATEEAKCAELFAAAVKRQSATAATQAARAQEVAEAELGECTFHPDVSAAAQAVAGKGTKEFMAKCLEWREEAERRLRQKYARQAELEAEQAAAAAAQIGVAAPGTAMTQKSRRLLEEPAVQERLKARPSLWESRKAAAESVSGQQSGVPVGSKVEEEQEAVLRTLRRRGDAGQDASLVHPSDVSPSGTVKGGAVVRQFLSRVEEDAKRRETAAAQLLWRYHNPEMAHYEAGTGQPLFAPNAMPTVWKGGRRVGYEDLSKDEQRDFCAELRKAGLEFVLARHIRGSSANHNRSSSGEAAAADESNDVAHPPGGALTADQQARFLASLQEALTRREQNLARVRAQATAEETFHPHITPRSTKLARHKIGSKPIHERSTAARDAAAVSPKSALHTTEAGATRSLYTAHRDRPLPEATDVFLARNDQWTGARQRRLERLFEMEQEKRLSDCTFTPNRTFYDPEYAHLQSGGPAAAAERGAAPSGPHDSSREGSEAARQRSAHMRQQDEMATAADVRLMNELELLRSGAAFRNEDFVQAVCERSGVADRRQAMAKLSLQSAPRLSSSRAGHSSAEPHHHRRHNTASTIRSTSRQISPIAERSNRPSASPYALPCRLDSYGEAPPHAAYETQRTVPMVRTESGATQTPTRHDSHARDDAAALRSAASRANARAAPAELPPVEDPWAALDAQTDAILKRHGY